MSSPIHHSARSGSISSTLRFCAVCCAAALVAWAIVSVPGTREATHPTVSASFGPPPTAPVRVMENTAVPHIAPVPVAICGTAVFSITRTGAVGGGPNEADTVGWVASLVPGTETIAHATKAAAQQTAQNRRVLEIEPLRAEW